MTIIAVFSVFAGMIVGIRFKIFAILPVIAVAALIAATVTGAQSDSVWSVLTASILCAMGAEVGYLCGSFVPLLKEVPETTPMRTTSASMPLDVRPRSVD